MQLLYDSVYAGFITVSKVDRGQTTATIQVFIPVQINDVRTIAFDDGSGRSNGELVVSFAIRVSSTRDKLVDFRTVFIRLREVSDQLEWSLALSS